MKIFNLLAVILVLTCESIFAQETKDYYYNKGIEYAVKGNFDSAKVEFLKAINIDSFYFSAHFSLERINDIHRKVVDDSTAILLFKALYFDNNNMSNEAIAEFNNTIELNPNYLWTYFARGCSYIILGKYPQAISDFNKFIEKNPYYSEAYNNRGYAFFYSGKYLRAFDDYNKAAELDPYNEQVYHNRGLANFYLEKDEEAIDDLTKAININPNDAIAYDDRGVAYLYDEQYSKALNDFNKSIQLMPDYALAFFNRGRVYRSTNHFEQALKEFSNSIELDPTLAFAYNDRGLLYIEEFDDQQKGCADLKKACELGFCQYYNKYIGDGDCK